MIIAIVIAVVVLILIGVGLIGGSHSPSVPPARLDQELHRRVRNADAEIHAEYRAARRAMNDAAGQSWRNLVD
ncbi:hypothetical protein [Gordonia otitidis]|uniref:hypothetical protein n=1 Tax=Gordonia otitidis TaxID=249058 RepID=UPI0023567866|nr:hypothetical protein [Gordonia otitidis]